MQLLTLSIYCRDENLHEEGTLLMASQEKACTIEPQHAWRRKHLASLLFSVTEGCNNQQKSDVKYS